MITTRERLLVAGIELIAERGFKTTTVGDIEVAVGLVPRSGALYKHFASKQALVEAGIQERIDQVATLMSLIALFTENPTPAERRATLMTTGQVVLDELEREELIARIIEKDGDRFPELRRSMHDNMVEPGFEFTEAALRLWSDGYTGTPAATKRLVALDLPAIAAVVLGSLVNFRRHQWMFGTEVHGIDETRFLNSWADMAMALFPTDDPDDDPMEET